MPTSTGGATRAAEALPSAAPGGSGLDPTALQSLSTVDLLQTLLAHAATGRTRVPPEAEHHLRSVLARLEPAVAGSPSPEDAP